MPPERSEVTADDDQTAIWRELRDERLTDFAEWSSAKYPVHPDRGRAHRTGTDSILLIMADIVPSATAKSNGPGGGHVLHQMQRAASNHRTGGARPTDRTPPELVKLPLERLLAPGTYSECAVFLRFSGQEDRVAEGRHVAFGVTYLDADELRLLCTGPPLHSA